MPSIGHICNLSLNQGTVPEDFKLACVTPIYKGKGLKSELGNYRPIYVISHISKILEKIVKDQIMDFLTDQNLVTEYQMAYIRGRSTQSAINFLTNHWLNIDNGLYTTACLIDLSKWFDCVNSDILLQKLTKYAINGIPLNWFRSYLSNRKQVVYFNNKISSVVNLNIGVPQGTVLGPILFLIYMNDLIDILPNKSCIMYDDITLFSSATNLQTAVSKLQYIINDTVTWIDQNKLIINVEKSRCITIGSRNKTLNSTFDLTIKGTKLKQVTEVNLLGVNIDQNLTWNNHCAAISKKISKQLGLIKMLRAFLPLHIVSNLYFPLIQSHMDYCITVWGNCAKTHLSIIQKLQNRAARILTGKYDYNLYPSSTLIRDMKWMSISQRFIYFISILMYNCINNPNLYKPLSNCFSFVADTHNYPTRVSKNKALKLPLPRTEIYKKSVTYSGAKIWNNIPYEIRTVSSVAIFKKNMKTYIFSTSK